MARVGVFTSSLFLRAAFGTLLLAGCGDDANSFPQGDYDADVTADASTTDTGGQLEFDIVQMDVVSPTIDTPPVGVDRGTTPDRPVTQPDTNTPPPDTSTTVCPSSCGSNADCNPCRSAGETGNYCCISGLCLYMTDMCSSTVPSDVPPGGGGDGGGDGGIPGGGGADGGFDAGGGADASGGFDAGGGAG